MEKNQVCLTLGVRAVPLKKIGKMKEGFEVDVSTTLISEDRTLIIEAGVEDKRRSITMPINLLFFPHFQN